MFASSVIHMSKNSEKVKNYLQLGFSFFIFFFLDTLCTINVCAVFFHLYLNCTHDSQWGYWTHRTQTYIRARERMYIFISLSDSCKLITSSLFYLSIYLISVIKILHLLLNYLLLIIAALKFSNIVKVLISSHCTCKIQWKFVIFINFDWRHLCMSASMRVPC